MAIDSFAVFCRNVAGLRMHSGYSQKYMAQLLGIGVESLKRIESGNIPPRLRIDVIFAVCRHFHIRTSVLFTQELYP